MEMHDSAFSFSNFEEISFKFEVNLGNNVKREENIPSSFDQVLCQSKEDFKYVWNNPAFLIHVSEVVSLMLQTPAAQVALAKQCSLVGKQVGFGSTFSFSLVRVLQTSVLFFDS